MEAEHELFVSTPAGRRIDFMDSAMNADRPASTLTGD